MFCKNCGASLDDDAIFCEKCGTAIKRVISDLPAQDADNPTLPEVKDFNIGEDCQKPSAIELDAKKKPKKKIVIGVVAIIFVIIAGALLSVALHNWGGNSKSSNIYHETNFNNGSQFAYDNDRLYIIGLYDEDDEETSLYSTDYKGVNKELISDNSNIEAIRLVDGKIYYRTSGDDEYTIGAMEKDGSENTTIVTSSDSLGHYDIYGDDLYYLQDGTIHMCSLTGEDDTEIISSVETFTLCNGFIYFVDENDVISSYKLNDGKTEELCKVSGAYNLSVSGETLYFACDTGLSSVLIDGSGDVVKIVRDDSLSNYIFYDNKIYYTHMMSDDERYEIAEDLGETSTEILAYKIMLNGVGSLYATESTGGDGAAIESDHTIICFLYGYPSGLYCKPARWWDSLEPIELE